MKLRVIHRRDKQAIFLCISHQYQRRYISLGIRCTESQWSTDTDRLKKNFPGYSSANRNIELKLIKAKEILDTISYRDDFNLDMFVSMFKKKNSQTSVVDYFQKWIDIFNKSGRYGNAFVYEQTMNLFKRIQPHVKFEGLDYRFLKKVETHLLSKGDKESTVSVYMRTLRALVNRAIKEDVTTFYGFDKYKITDLDTSTMPKALSLEQLLAIIRCEPVGKRQRDSKSYFLFSLYTMGMNFIDMCFLEYSSIENGRIRYKRRKTGRWYNIELLEPAGEIIEQYRYDGNFVFPILRGKKNPNISIQTALRNHNKSLKDLAKSAGLSVKLSHNMARHTWATLQKRHGQPTAIISEGLGHRTEKITQVYLDKFEHSVLDDANRSLHDYIQNQKQSK